MISAPAIAAPRLFVLFSLHNAANLRWHPPRHTI
jgi:hypothetical protein